MFTDILENNFTSLILSGVVLWFFWRLTIETSKQENFGNGAIGPYAISTAAQAFATRPTHGASDRIHFRYLNDLTNW